MTDPRAALALTRAGVAHLRDMGPVVAGLAADMSRIRTENHVAARAAALFGARRW